LTIEVYTGRIPLLFLVFAPPIMAVIVMVIIKNRSSLSPGMKREAQRSPKRANKNYSGGCSKLLLSVGRVIYYKR